MSASARWARAQKAIEEGKKAYLDGVPRSHCPYKVSDWGLGDWWLIGYREKCQELSEYINHLNAKESER